MREYLLMAFVSSGVYAAEGIRTDTFTIRAITTDDVQLDYDAVMESREFLRQWEQSTWPEDDFTVEANLEDLEKMVTRHRDGYAFGYTVMNPAETECLGCIYVFAPDAKMYQGVDVASVGDMPWSDVDATIYFWARASAVEQGFDRTLLDAIRLWLDHAWAFDRYVIVTNEQFVQQVTMIEATDLVLGFTFNRDGEPGTYRCYH